MTVAKEKPGGVTTYGPPSFWFDLDRPERVRVCAGGLHPFTVYGVTLKPRECREFIKDDEAPEGWVPVKE
jgi:hypothetical protein